MGFFRSSKKVASKVVDVRVDKWLSVDYLKETTGHFKSILVGLITPQKAKYSETYEEALLRLNLTEKDVEERKVEFKKLLIFFVVLAVVVILYGLFMAYRGSFVPALVAFCLALYALTQAFRFHFWLFQLRNRKLGCSFKEWLDSEVHSKPSTEIIPKNKDDIIARKTNDKG